MTGDVQEKLIPKEMVLAINFEALHRVFYMRIECNS